MDIPLMSGSDAMATRRTGKHKEHSSPAPTATAANKEAFIKALAAGNAPGCAATMVDIARSTAYEWKKADAAFSAKWDNAVETSLDKLETEAYEIAREDPENLGIRLRAIEMTLKNRRYGTADHTMPARQQTNFILNVTMEEHFKRLTRMGVPLPEIESDYEDMDAPTRKREA